VIKETQVICRCGGYITDGNGDDIDNEHVIAMLTLEGRSEAEEPDGQTKERASGHFSTRACDTRRKEQAFYQTESIHTAPLDGSKQAGCSTNTMKFTRKS